MERRIEIEGETAMEPSCSVVPCGFTEVSSVWVVTASVAGVKFKAGLKSNFPRAEGEVEVGVVVEVSHLD